MKNIVLIGYMGSGKSSVAKALSVKTGMKLLDTDQQIEKEENRRISDIFAADGEQAFRDMETALLKKMLNDGFQGIISTGGGMPVRDENRPLLKQLGQVIYLKTGVDTLTMRLTGDGSRPLLQGETAESKRRKIEEMLTRREPSYMEASDAVIPTDDVTTDALADEILLYMSYADID
ncbi:MAG: shikimate kinase [Lachnospiraceae bacterium]|nr:shikimate kinase [Lachnospiraceae bacterium]